MLYYGKYDEDDKADWRVLNAEGPGSLDVFWDRERGCYVAVCYDEFGELMIVDEFDHRPY